MIAGLVSDCHDVCRGCSATGDVPACDDCVIKYRLSMGEVVARDCLQCNGRSVAATGARAGMTRAQWGIVEHSID